MTQGILTLLIRSIAGVALEDTTHKHPDPHTITTRETCPDWALK